MAKKPFPSLFIKSTLTIPDPSPNASLVTLPGGTLLNVEANKHLVVGYVPIVFAGILGDPFLNEIAFYYIDPAVLDDADGIRVIKASDDSTVAGAWSYKTDDLPTSSNAMWQEFENTGKLFLYFNPTSNFDPTSDYYVKVEKELDYLTFDRR
jgi:hypothetical protein